MLTVHVSGCWIFSGSIRLHSEKLAGFRTKLLFRRFQCPTSSAAILVQIFEEKGPKSHSMDRRERLKRLRNCSDCGSNTGHYALQAYALPTELSKLRLILVESKAYMTPRLFGKIGKMP